MQDRRGSARRTMVPRPPSSLERSRPRRSRAAARQAKKRRRDADAPARPPSAVAADVGVDGRGRWPATAPAEAGRENAWKRRRSSTERRQSAGGASEAAGGREDSTRRLGSLGLTFEADAGDHCETDPAAFKDLAPVLRVLAEQVARKRAASSGSGGPSSWLRIWDPYYCKGASQQHLASLGFTKVHHANEDFYELLRAGRAPSHDVLVTNPAYSGDHIERCVGHCVTSGKPWCLLLPHWVFAKDWYVNLLKTCPALLASPPFYLGPAAGTYSYWIPAVAARPAHVSADGQTTPFKSCWYVHVPSPDTAKKLLAALEKEQKGTSWVTALTVRGLKWKALQRTGKSSAPATRDTEGAKAARRRAGPSKRRRRPASS